MINNEKKRWLPSAAYQLFVLKNIFCTISILHRLFQCSIKPESKCLTQNNEIIFKFLQAQNMV